MLQQKLLHGSQCSRASALGCIRLNAAQIHSYKQTSISCSDELDSS